MEQMHAPVLDELELIVVVDNETDTLSSVDDGLPQQPEIASLLGRLAPDRHHDGDACTSVFDLRGKRSATTGSSLRFILEARPGLRRCGPHLLRVSKAARRIHDA